MADQKISELTHNATPATTNKVPMATAASANEYSTLAEIAAVIGSGDSIQVNAVAVTDANLNDSSPAAAGGGVNVKWQRTGTGPDSVSAYVQAASSTAKGAVELATQAEMNTGTSTTLVPPVSVARYLPANQLWVGNGSNIATPVGAGLAPVGMGSPWLHSTTTDPDETDDGYAEGWQWLNTTNGKLWQCLDNTASAAVWRCLNTVVETDASATTTRTVDNTWDGSIKRYTNNTSGITINVPNGLNNGLTFEVIDHSGQQITITMSSGSVRVPSTFLAKTNEQYSSLTVSVQDSDECMVRGDLAAA